MRKNIVLAVVCLIGLVGLFACSGGTDTVITSAPLWYVKDGVYTVYGSNTFTTAGIQPHPVQIHIPKQVDWTYIGESNTICTFQTNTSYRSILIGWSGSTRFYFDAIVDENTGVAWGSGQSNGDTWYTSYMVNYLTNTSDTGPSQFYGPPDGKYSYQPNNDPGVSLTPFMTTVDSGTGKGSITVYATTLP